MYTYGWFMLRFDRIQQNSVKQLSFNEKKKLLKKRCLRKKKKKQTLPLFLFPASAESFKVSQF